MLASILRHVPGMPVDTTIGKPPHHPDTASESSTPNDSTCNDPSTEHRHEPALPACASSSTERKQAPALADSNVSTPAAGRMLCEDIPIMQLLSTDEDFNEAYRLGMELGRGGFAAVFLATREESKPLAVKVINKSEQIVTHGSRALRRMRDECRVHAALEHPHIVQLVDVCESPTNIYIVMEFAEAGALLERIITRGALAESEALRLLRQLITVLRFLHSRGVIHRDVKPENILLYSSSTTPGAMDMKLCDFGLAKILRRTPCAAAGAHADAQSADTTTAGDAKPTTADPRRLLLPIGRCNSSVGSPMYRAPEQVFCQPPYPTTYGAGVDVWAAGCVAYNMLSASYPFERKETPAPPAATSALLQPDSCSRRRSGRQRWGTISHSSAPLICHEDPLEGVLGPHCRRHVFPASVFATVSAAAKSAIDAMLTVDQRHRPTASEMLSHPWLLSPQPRGVGIAALPPPLPEAEATCEAAPPRVTPPSFKDEPALPQAHPQPQPQPDVSSAQGGDSNSSGSIPQRRQRQPTQRQPSRRHRLHTITDESFFRELAERLEVCEEPHNIGGRGRRDRRERTWHEGDDVECKDTVERFWRREGSRSDKSREG